MKRAKLATTVASVTETYLVPLEEVLKQLDISMNNVIDTEARVVMEGVRKDRAYKEDEEDEWVDALVITVKRQLNNKRKRRTA